jgi:hypothetical protein
MGRCCMNVGILLVTLLFLCSHAGLVSAFLFLQIGDGSNTDRLTPVKLTLSSQLDRAVAVSAGLVRCLSCVLVCVGEKGTQESAASLWGVVSFAASFGIAIMVAGMLSLHTRHS